MPNTGEYLIEPINLENRTRTSYRTLNINSKTKSFDGLFKFKKYNLLPELATKEVLTPRYRCSAVVATAAAAAAAASKLIRYLEFSERPEPIAGGCSLISFVQAVDSETPRRSLPLPPKVRADPRCTAQRVQSSLRFFQLRDSSVCLLVDRSSLWRSIFNSYRQILFCRIMPN